MAMQPGQAPPAHEEPANGPAGGDEDGLEPVCFAAAIENRAKEVGVALLDLASLRLELAQFVEPGRLYTSTLLHLAPRGARQVVVVGTQHHEACGRARGARGALRLATRGCAAPLIGRAPLRSCLRVRAR